MTFTPKAWQDSPNATTPISAAALVDLETRLTTYTDVQTINAQTGTTYTLALTDQSALVTLSNAALVTLTIPAFVTVALPVGSHVDLYCKSASGSTIATAVGVSVQTPTGVSGPAQAGWCRLLCIATNSWITIGLEWQVPVNITPPVVS